MVCVPSRGRHSRCVAEQHKECICLVTTSLHHNLGSPSPWMCRMDVHAHSEGGELELEDLPDDSTLDRCAVAGSGQGERGGSGYGKPCIPSLVWHTCTHSASPATRPCRSCLFLGLMREPGYVLNKKTKQDVDLKASLVWRAVVWAQGASWGRLAGTVLAVGGTIHALELSLAAPLCTPARRCPCWPRASWCSAWCWRSGVGPPRSWRRCVRRWRTCAVPPLARPWRSSEQQC